jgi:hypothetical protein
MSIRSSTSRTRWPHLAFDDLALARAPVLAAHAHQLQRGDDGRQRIAQLVAQHGQEFVLGLAGGRQFGQQFRALGMGALDLLAAAHVLGDVDRHQITPRSSPSPPPAARG